MTDPITLTGKDGIEQFVVSNYEYVGDDVDDLVENLHQACRQAYGRFDSQNRVHIGDVENGSFNCQISCFDPYNETLRHPHHIVNNSTSGEQIFDIREEANYVYAEANLRFGNKDFSSPGSPFVELTYEPADDFDSFTEFVIDRGGRQPHIILTDYTFTSQLRDRVFTNEFPHITEHRIYAEEGDEYEILVPKRFAVGMREFAEDAKETPAIHNRPIPPSVQQEEDDYVYMPFILEDVTNNTEYTFAPRGICLDDVDEETDEVDPCKHYDIMEFLNMLTSGVALPPTRENQSTTTSTQKLESVSF